MEPIDLRKRFKVGDVLVQRYRWKGEAERDYYAVITSFKMPDLIYADTFAVKRNGKWERTQRQNRAFWDFYFRIGSAMPEQGWGRAFKSKLTYKQIMRKLR